MLKLNFTSFPILETERIILRAHHLADANAIYDLRNNEEVMRYIDRPRPIDVQETKDFIHTINEGYAKGLNLAWVMALKENPVVIIGSIGYWRTDLANHRAEIGYMLLPNYWRKGLVSEALVKTLTFGFEEINLHSICATINPGNDASRQILLKHGFEKEAYFKEDFYFNGKFLDTEVYGLINPDH